MGDVYTWNCTVLCFVYAQAGCAAAEAAARLERATFEKDDALAKLQRGIKQQADLELQVQAGSGLPGKLKSCMLAHIAASTLKAAAQACA